MGNGTVLSLLSFEFARSTFYYKMIHAKTFSI